MLLCSAIRYNTALKQFHDRLRASEKVSKVAVIASARKLPTILDAMVRDIKVGREQGVTNELTSSTVAYQQPCKGKCGLGLLLSARLKFTAASRLRKNILAIRPEII